MLVEEKSSNIGYVARLRVVTSDSVIIDNCISWFNLSKALINVGLRMQK